MARLRLIVADDNPSFLRRLVWLLQLECGIVETAADGKSALDLIRHRKPDVVVLDLVMPRLNGLQVTRELSKQPQSPPVVICSVETDSEIVEAALRAGAMGYVCKRRIKQDLVRAVQSAHRGESFVSVEGISTDRTDHAKLFKSMGRRIRKLCQEAGLSQEDMESFGFSARHWQQIEAGRPTTMTTVFRICEVFKIEPDELFRDLRQDSYDNWTGPTPR